MSEPTAQSCDLSESLNRFRDELLFAKYCLDTYKIIGLNARDINDAKTFYGHVQRMSHLHIAMSLAKIYERETSHHLCSIAGICRLLVAREVRNQAAIDGLARKYSVQPTADWQSDLALIRKQQGTKLRRPIATIRKLRNTRLAHLAAGPTTDVAPSIAAFEALLEFPIDLYSAVRDGFENVSTHKILQDNRQANSLTKILRLSGLEHVKRTFSDI